MKAIFRPAFIQIDSIQHPDEPGAIMCLYCPQCRRSTFVWDPWAPKPNNNGDYWRVEGACYDFPAHSFNQTPPRKFDIDWPMTVRYLERPWR